MHVYAQRTYKHNRNLLLESFNSELQGVTVQPELCDESDKACTLGGWYS